MPEKDDKPTDVYYSFQEFCQRISKLNLPVGWSINISEFAYIKKSDNIHGLLQFEIIVDLNLAFKIRTFALFIPPDHDAYTTYKNSVKNITLTNLIKLLSSYKLCTGVENEIARKSSTPHTVPHNIKHCNTSLNKPNIYFRPESCHILVKNEQKCKIFQKFGNSSISKANKIFKRQPIILSTPAKLNAPISKTSSERLKLTIQSFRIENKELKEKVMELQQELSKSSLKVSENLDEDLTSIMAGVDQRDILPFMKFLGRTTEVYRGIIQRNSIPSNDNTILLIIGIKVGISI